MTVAKQKEYGLLLRRHFEYGNERVHALVISREDDYPRGCASDGEWGYDKAVPKHVHGLLLDGLGMYGFVTDGRDPTFIGDGVEYRDVFGFDLRKAERAVRTLKRVAARMERDQAREPGDRLVSLAAALKLSFVTERIPNSGRFGTGEGGAWSDSDWRFMSISEGRNRYRALIEEAVAAQKQREGIAA